MSKGFTLNPTFQKTWLGNPKYKLWLAVVPSDEKTARCILCKKDINVLVMGVSALESHATGKKQKSLMKERKQYSETFFSQKKSSERNAEKKEGQSTSTIQKETGKQKQSAKSIDQYAVSINSLNAEILWCMYVVKGHLSYNLCSNIKELFNVMFPG